MKIQFVSNKSQSLIKLVLENTQLNFNQVKLILRKKDIKINGKRVNSDILVLPNSTVEIFSPDKKINLDVVYQDNNVIVINKPTNLEVTSSSPAEQTLEKLTNAFAVHRLDRNTSGLVILAKNNIAKQELDFAFKNKFVKKFYTAVVVGKPKQIKENLTAYLVKDAKNSLVKIFDDKVANSVQIKTNYQLLQSNNNLSSLKIELLTGKTHQIRAHLAHINLPVLGDEKYGNKLVNKKYSKHRQMLVATSLSFNFKATSPLNYLNDRTFVIDPKLEI